MKYKLVIRWSMLFLVVDPVHRKIPILLIAIVNYWKHGTLPLTAQSPCCQPLTLVTTLPSHRAV